VYEFLRVGSTRNKKPKKKGDFKNPGKGKRVEICTGLKKKEFTFECRKAVWED